MSNIPRVKANVLTALKNFDAPNLEKIKKNGAKDFNYWNIDDKHPDYALVGEFRRQVKDHYYYRQGRRCCYCSKELDTVKSTYDAEHILHKAGHPHFMFELNNISVSCRRCNGRKKTYEVLSIPGFRQVVPTTTQDYSIVHPHIDEWKKYLEFDGFGRIYAPNGNSKGRETIKMCGIEGLNATRLSDHFLPGDNKLAEETLEGFYRVKSIIWKRKKLAILEKIVLEHNLQFAKMIVDFLKNEVDMIGGNAQKNETVGSP